MTEVGRARTCMDASCMLAVGSWVERARTGMSRNQLVESIGIHAIGVKIGRETYDLPVHRCSHTVRLYCGRKKTVVVSLVGSFNFVRVPH